MDADCAAIVVQARAEFGKSELRVVARANGFDDRCYAVRKQSGEQDGGLHLRAGNGKRVLDRRQPRAFDLQRGVASIAGLNPRAHLRQRIDHAAHGAAPQGTIAIDGRTKLLPGKNSRQQTHGCPGVPRIERAARLAQSTEAGSGDADTVPLRFHLDAQT